MKRTSFILIMLLCTLFLWGCGAEEPLGEDACQVYYVSNSETRVEMHPYVVDATEDSGRLEALLEALGTMPEKLEYKAPLAMGFEILDKDLTEGRLLLDMSDAYLQLPGTTEVLVRAAIVRTLTQLESVSFVRFTVEGEQLYDVAGDAVSWMSGEQFIENDGNEINTYEEVKIKLYFADEAGDKLISGFREKHYSTNTPLERFVVEELIAGPSGEIEGMYPTINPQTKVINVLSKDGICYVNLDENFLTLVGNVTLEASVYSIVNSLVELSNVNKVQILVNGEIPAVFSTVTFERNLDVLTSLDKGKD